MFNDHTAVLQDQRGAFLSEGNFDVWRKDGVDGYDTMEWIASQPWSNGDVYTIGVSADACSSFTTVKAPEQPIWHKGAVYMWGSAEGHDTMYQGGAYRQALVDSWMTVMCVTPSLFPLRFSAG